jgi:hypothetical protein
MKLHKAVDQILSKYDSRLDDHYCRLQIEGDIRALLDANEIDDLVVYVHGHSGHPIASIYQVDDFPPWRSCDCRTCKGGALNGVIRGGMCHE